MNDKLFSFCVGCEPEDIAVRIIITPVFPMNLFKENYEIKKSFKGRIYSGISIEHNGKSVTIIRCGIGASMAGDLVVLLKKAKPEKIVFLGSCGGFGNLKIGDIVIAEKVFDGEGFSRYFNNENGFEGILADGKYINCEKQIFNETVQHLKNRSEKHNVINGKVYTIGSFAVEKIYNMQTLEDKGFDCVEMELSAVYTAGYYVKVPVAGILAVSDIPLKRSIEDGLDNSQMMKYDETVKFLAKSVMKNLLQI
ncbi:MAG: hypothetical protein HQL29_04995 [Candidatus Omnitrophica bacterium]|nr:hypothetical protein [Candidatus Omnitrophota bacterium]